MQRFQMYGVWNLSVTSAWPSSDRPFAQVELTAKMIPLSYKLFSQTTHHSKIAKKSFLGAEETWSQDCKNEFTWKKVCSVLLWREEFLCTNVANVRFGLVQEVLRLNRTRTGSTFPRVCRTANRTACEPRFGSRRFGSRFEPGSNRRTDRTKRGATEEGAQEKGNIEKGGGVGV